MEAVPLLALVGEADALAFDAVLDFSLELMTVILTVICFTSATAHGILGTAQLVAHRHVSLDTVNRQCGFLRCRPAKASELSALRHLV
jgi:hypothetical protein